MTRVLVVEDEPPLVRALTINLQARAYEVDAASDGTTALRLAAERRPDVVVLDLGLPDTDGIEVIKALRGWTRVPVVVLSARCTTHEKVEAFEAGADDYITKPFDMAELLARLRAAVRRNTRDGAGGVLPADESPSLTVTTADFTVDLAAKKVRRDGRPVRLTPTEWHLLEILVRTPGRLISQRQLLEEVWGTTFATRTNYLRVYMAQLRRKLEKDPSRPRYLITEPGMGYRFAG
ncbi:response regulator [Streptomyces arboris]|uniref:Transcriptional regulatory protein KdpE n=1 Tax=Streptomyces arboris TaxID=2600619 RepID=A0A5N5EBN5_9ACTN|nr:response regulator transcription factor [Streptomyces arboris]KAB2588068.1 response regulator transcription factor [Streptomyces arboris]